MHETLTAIATDLHTVTDNLRWCSTQAWWPRGRALDAPMGRALPPLDPDLGPDDVPGPRLATGIGDHAAQQAIVTATVHLAKVETELDQAVLIAMTVGAIDQKRQPVRYGNRPNLAARMLPALRWRIVTLAPARLEQCHAKSVSRHLDTARREIDMAWRSLDAVLTKGEVDPVEQAVADRDKCRVCAIRPVRISKSGRSKKDGRCNTCQTWWQRNRFERPTHLDPGTKARQAQQRRLNRGDGWGDESLTATTDPPLHDYPDSGPVQSGKRTS